MDDGDRAKLPSGVDPDGASQQVIEALAQAQHTAAEQRRLRVNDLSEILTRVGALQDAVSGLVIAEKGREQQSTLVETQLREVTQSRLGALRGAMDGSRDEAAAQAERAKTAEAAGRTTQSELETAQAALAESQREHAELLSSLQASQASHERTTRELERRSAERDQLSQQLRETLDGVTDAMLQQASSEQSLAAATKARDEALAELQAAREGQDKACSELRVQRDDALARMSQAIQRHQTELETLVDSHRDRLDQIAEDRAAEAKSNQALQIELKGQIENAQRGVEEASRASLKLMHERDQVRKLLGDLTGERERQSQEASSQLSAVRKERDQALAQLAAANVERDALRVEAERGVSERQVGEAELGQLRLALERAQGDLILMTQERDQAVDEVAQLVEQLSEDGSDVQQASADELSRTTLDMEELQSQIELLTVERNLAREDAARHRAERDLVVQAQSPVVADLRASADEALPAIRKQGVTAPSPSRRPSRKTTAARMPRVSTPPEASVQLPLTAASPGVYRMTAVDIRDDLNSSTGSRKDSGQDSQRGSTKKRKR
jgi:chromosome segregation ATPase